MADPIYQQLTTQYHAQYEAHRQRMQMQDPILAGKVADYKYQAFLSQPVRQSDGETLYVCGLKPYAQAGKVYSFPPEFLPPDYHAYLDETWSTPYVARALRLMEFVQEELLERPSDARQSLVTNWFWQRAEDAKQLQQMGLRLADPVELHRLLLNYFQPRVVLCIGNGQSFSAFAGMCLLHTIEPDQIVQQAYLERSRLKAARSDDRLVIGIPHLSRYPVREELLLWLKDLKNYRAD